jgi:hypothetical protein
MKRKQRIQLCSVSLSLVTALSLPAGASACDLCAIYSAYETSEGSPGGITLGLAQQYTAYEAASTGAAAEILDEQSLDSSVVQLYAAYRISERFEVQANVPYIYRDYKRTKGRLSESGDEFGFGDSSVLVSYEPWQLRDGSQLLTWRLYSGIKLPTGDDDRLKEEAEEGVERIAQLSHGQVDGSLVSGADLALGSGSIDIPFGTSLLYQFNRLQFSADVQYVLRNEGSYDFEYGDGLFFSVGSGGHVYVDHDSQLALRLKFSGDFKDKDSIRGDEITKSDQNKLFLGPEVLFTHGQRLLARLGYDFVVADDSESRGIQPEGRLSCALSYRF